MYIFIWKKAEIREKRNKCKIICRCRRDDSQIHWVHCDILIHTVVVSVLPFLRFGIHSSPTQFAVATCAYSCRRRETYARTDAYTQDQNVFILWIRLFQMNETMHNTQMPFHIIPRIPLRGSERRRKSAANENKRNRLNCKFTLIVVNFNANEQQ